jgi:raffinose/stachyose/melibiose transport system permease protein
MANQTLAGTGAMRNRHGLNTVAFLSQIVLVGAAAATLIPMIWVLVSSLKDNNQIFAASFSLPRVWHFENYARAWVVGNIGSCFLNSGLVSLVSVLGILYIAAMAAYALARYQFRLNFALYTYFLMGLMIPWASNLLPLFLTLKAIRAYDTLWALILPYVAFELPFAIFILTGFMKTIPGELEEAALIDGGSRWIVFTRVILPLSKPALATVAVLTFLDVWNEYLFALVFLNNPAKFTLPLGLAAFQTARVAQYGVIMAGIIISVIPVLILYVLLQKQVIKGMTAGALKG